jgi:branched-chain amino acid transport system substrate-binding protein
VKAKEKEFYDAYAVAGSHPEVSACFAWDPARVLIDALRHAGPQPTAAKVKAYIEQLHDFPGINGMMDFRDGDQRGVSMSAIVVLRWDPAKATFIGVSNPGGTPR